MFTNHNMDQHRTNFHGQAPAGADGRPARHSRGGFTLLEVILALGVMALLTGAMFTLVQGAMQATAELHHRQNRMQEVNGLVELCGRAFRNLPGEAVFEATMREEEGVYVQELLFLEAPRAFSWGGSSQGLGMTLLSARPQLGGLLNLSLLWENTETDEAASPLNMDEASRWLVLIADLHKVQWRFYDPRSSTWMDEWKDSAARPSLVELTLNLAGETEPIRSVFWVPALTKVPPPSIAPRPRT